MKSFNEFLNLTSISKNRLTSQLSVDSANKLSIVNNPKFTVTSAGSDSRVNSIDSIETSLARKLIDESSPDDSQDYFPMTTSMTRELKLEMENLDRQVFGGSYPNSLIRADTPESIDSIKSPFLKNVSSIGYYQLSNQASSIDAIETDTQEEQKETVCKVKMRNKVIDDEANLKRISSCSNNNEVFTWQNPLNQFGSSEFNHSNLQVNEKTSPIQISATTPDEQADIEFDPPGEIIEVSHGKKSVTPIRLVRKTDNDSTTGVYDATKRLSTLLVESSSEESDDQKSQIKLNANNPFYEQIQEMNKKMDDGAILNTSSEKSLVESINVQENDTELPNQEVNELPPPSGKW